MISDNIVVIIIVGLLALFAIVIIIKIYNGDISNIEADGKSKSIRLSFQNKKAESELVKELEDTIGDLKLQVQNYDIKLKQLTDANNQHKEILAKNIELVKLQFKGKVRSLENRIEELETIIEDNEILINENTELLKYKDLVSSLYVILYDELLTIIIKNDIHKYSDKELKDYKHSLLKLMILKYTELVNSDKFNSLVNKEKLIESNIDLFRPLLDVLIDSIFSNHKQKRERLDKYNGSLNYKIHNLTNNIVDNNKILSLIYTYNQILTKYEKSLIKDELLSVEHTLLRLNKLLLALYIETMYNKSE